MGESRAVRGADVDRMVFRGGEAVLIMPTPGRKDVEVGEVRQIVVPRFMTRIMVMPGVVICIVPRVIPTWIIICR